MSNPEYRLVIKVRNGPLCRAMDAAGIKTAAELSRKSGVTQNMIGRYLGLKIRPLRLDLTWRTDVIRLSEFFRCLPEDLFPRRLVEKVLPKTCVTIDLTESQIEGLVGQKSELNGEMKMLRDETATTIIRGLACLTPREERVLRMRFGFNGTMAMSLEECADEFAVTRERIRQIEARGLRRLKGGIYGEELNECRGAE